MLENELLANKLRFYLAIILLLWIYNKISISVLNFMHRAVKSLYCFLIVVFVLNVVGNYNLLAQPIVPIAAGGNTNINPEQDTAKAKNTSDPTIVDSNNTNGGLTIEQLESKWGIKISRDAISSTIATTAKDSAILDVKNSLHYLHGEATAEYENIKIRSAHFTFNQKISEVLATPNYDTMGKRISLQEFEQGEEKFVYDTLRYNFNSKRAIVRNARSQYGEGFIHSLQVKRNQDESIYGWKNLYTTCNIEDHPHFGIRSNKIKIVPNKVVVTGRANLEIQEIPTPLVLPFGVFPAQKGQRSGFIIPSYTLEANRGLGLQRGGYYMAIGEHLGVVAQMDIFSKGSWALFTTTQYANRYRYSGNVNINYSFTRWGEEYEPTGGESKDFKINWNHQMDPKARPGTNFSAAVDVGTSSYNMLNGMSANMQLTNNYNSSISYSKTWVGKPYSFNASVRHNQNTQTGLVSLSLPELNFNIGQFSPFQRKKMIGAPKWYEKINVSYAVSALNRWDFIDSTFSMEQIAIRNFDNGILHSANIQANYNVLKYFTLNFNVPYREYWNTKQKFNYYDPQTDTRDTVVHQGFYTSRYFDASTNLSTRIYGVKMFRNAKVMGIRHVLMPSVGLSYIPSFAHNPFNYMYQTYDYYGDEVYYSPYTSGVGGPTNSINTGAVTFSLNNTLQVKVKGKDSLSNKNISLFDRFNFSGNYNMFADSNNLSDINTSFATSVLGKLNVSGNMVFTPYVYDGRRRTKEYLFQADKGVLDFNSGNIALGISFDGTNKNRGTENDTTTIEDEQQRDAYKKLMQNGGREDYYDFNIPWNLSLNAGVRVVRVRSDDRPDSLLYQPNFTFYGGFNLTPRWKINVTSGLDFTPKKDANGGSKMGLAMGYTMIDITRDLHCWQMSLNLVPFGMFRSFFFTLNVKASVLQDLKLTRRRAFQDNY